jgi:hypothetical protein
MENSDRTHTFSSPFTLQLQRTKPVLPRASTAGRA